MNQYQSDWQKCQIADNHMIKTDNCSVSVHNWYPKEVICARADYNSLNIGDESAYIKALITDGHLSLWVDIFRIPGLTLTFRCRRAQ